MKLSIIIVSYNVVHFLEQCLHSVFTATEGLEAEVFVVDNASVDGSVKMVTGKFPNVVCMANKENVGFSKANNQAIAQAKGEYVLLLNPDTVVEDTTFRKCIDFMDAHADCGGLGVKMVDGTGRFLPESKRGLPTPAVAFCKMFGLSKLFPKSKRFNRYHLGHLDKEKTAPVDVLSGAYMMLRKEALDKTGSLDETFFMYGEDIDLSYRITQAGYRNYYFAGTRIIHYKGESTKKGSLNYVYLFYNAMAIFAKKHFSPKNAKLFSLLISMAIWFRAGITLLTQVAKRIFLPVFDFLLIYGGMFIIVRYWERFVRYETGGHYPERFYLITLVSLTLFWLFSIWLSGGYDKPVNLMKIFRGLFIGGLLTLSAYALLPESWRFSRAILVIGIIWAAGAVIGFRFLLHACGIRRFSLNQNKHKRILIVGDPDESLRVNELVKQTSVIQGAEGMIFPNLHDEPNGIKHYIGNLSQLPEIIKIYKINEIIFCAADVPAQTIIDYMAELSHHEVDFKIAPPQSLSIIGSNSINTAGDLYVIDVNSIKKAENRRSKRLFDLLTSGALLISYPVTLWFVRQPFRYFWNILNVLIGNYSWSGYYPIRDPDHKLPKIKRGILFPTDMLPDKQLNADVINRLNMMYARDYKLKIEFLLILKGFRKLGRKVNDCHKP